MSTLSFSGLSLGDYRQIGSGPWRVDLIRRTDGDYYIACQRDKPTRRLFDVTVCCESAAIGAAEMRMIEVDRADGVGV